MSFSFGTIGKKIGSLFDGKSSSLVSKSKIKYHSIRDGLDSQYRIIIEGKVSPAASRIEICLLAFDTLSDENQHSGDIALKLVIVPSGGYAILSSRVKGHWSEEERTQRGRLPPPLMQMNKFTMEVIVEPMQYRVEVNNVLFVAYQHRVSLDKVRMLSYDGDFELLELFVQPPPSLGFHTAPAVSPLPSPSPTPSAPSSSTSSTAHLPSREVTASGTLLHSPKLPVLLPIKGGLQPGTVLSLIDCHVTGNRFDISFYHGNDPYQNQEGVVAFHMEVYLDEKTIVRNTYKNGKWQKEERDDLESFPFQMGKKFSLEVFVEGNRFKVNVDGENLFVFYHRLLPISMIDHLGVHGHISLPILKLSHLL